MDGLPGGPVVNTPHSSVRERNVPGWGAKTPHTSWPKSKNMKQKQYWNKFNKDYKNGPHQKSLKEMHMDLELEIYLKAISQ